MPPQAGGEQAKRPKGASDRRERQAAPKQSGGDLATLGKYIGKAGSKAAEMGRFFASEWLREPGAQQMLVKKAEPFLKRGIDQLSTVIRPKRNYKTNRKDLDGSGLLSNLAYGFNYAPWTRPKRGKGVDIHKAIGKLPKPQRGFTLPGHNYTGPYNPLSDQLRFNPETGHWLARNIINTKQKMGMGASGASRPTAGRGAAAKNARRF